MSAVIPATFAIASRVRSSSVGPMPPVVMTIGDQPDSFPQNILHSFQRVAHGGGEEADFDADFRQAFRDEGCVRVDDLPEQQLRADRHQLR